MSWLMWGAAASGWSAAIGVLLVLTSRSARSETAQTLRLRALVEPYLLRRAQELGLVVAGTAPSTDGLEEVVDCLCRLAERLAAREREELTPSQQMAVARTLPIERPTR